MTEPSPWHVGDTTPALTGTCTNAGTPVDLTSAAVEIHVRRPDRTVITRPATTTTAEGVWTMAWTDEDLTVAGTHTVEAQVTYADESVQTFGPQTFQVAQQIA